jgi:hypothetical protein
MEPSIDVRKIADMVFERAQRYCQEHGVLVRGCFLLTSSGELTVLSREDSDAAERERCQPFRRMAPESDPVAIFTLRDSRYRCFPREDPLRPGEDEGVPDGWIADGKLHDCLNLRIEVPGEKAFCVAAPYHWDEDGTIAFGEASEGAEDFAGPAPPCCASEEGLRN